MVWNPPFAFGDGQVPLRERLAVLESQRRVDPLCALPVQRHGNAARAARLLGFQAAHCRFRSSMAGSSAQPRLDRERARGLKPRCCAVWRCPCRRSRRSNAAKPVFGYRRKRQRTAFASAAAVASLRARRDLDQFLELDVAERRRQELELDRVLHALAQSHDFFGLQALLGNELPQHEAHRWLRQTREREVARHGLGLEYIQSTVSLYAFM